MTSPATDLYRCEHCGACGHSEVMCIRLRLDWLTICLPRFTGDPIWSQFERPEEQWGRA
jgi:hypothetical protein